MVPKALLFPIEFSHLQLLMVMFSLSLDSWHFQTLYHHSELSKLLISKNQLLALHFVFINITLIQCYNSTNYNIIYTVLSGVPHIYLTCSGAFLIKFIIIATDVRPTHEKWNHPYLQSRESQNHSTEFSFSTVTIHACLLTEMNVLVSATEHFLSTFRETVQSKLNLHRHKELIH